MLPFLWMLSYALAPHHEKDFQADENGRWRFRKHGLFTFGVSIKVRSSGGYKASGKVYYEASGKVAKLSTGPIDETWNMHTNVVLRLLKVDGGVGNEQSP